MKPRVTFRIATSTEVNVEFSQSRHCINRMTVYDHYLRKRNNCVCSVSLIHCRVLLHLRVPSPAPKKSQYVRNPNFISGNRQLTLLDPTEIL
jgi:hypothetical protein